MHLRRILLALIGAAAWLPWVALAAGQAPAAGPLRAGDYQRSFPHGGLTRTYLLHLPETALAKREVPVVLAYHGGATNMRLMERYVDLDRVADREGFAVVYPNGTGRLRRILAWNAGGCCGYAQSKRVDDVGMTAALLDDLAKVVRIDPRRIYATGISNGAMMAYRLACELSGRIAAIAPVAGTMMADECKPARPVPVLEFHGTADRHVPLQGGKGALSIAGVPFVPVQETIDFWRKVDRCPEAATTGEVEDRAGDGTSATRKTWSPCKGGSEVGLVVIRNGGHTWPGVATRLKAELGISTKNLSASEVMWDFFKRHPMPAKTAEPRP